MLYTQTVAVCPEIYTKQAPAVSQNTEEPAKRSATDTRQPGAAT